MRRRLKRPAEPMQPKNPRWPQIATTLVKLWWLMLHLKELEITNYGY
jgi:hypothetical protein